MTTIEQAIHLRQSGQLDQARELLLELIEKEPLNPKAWYQCAWAHDVLEREREAVPYYLKALELNLQGEDREGAYLGLGSTLRTLGKYEEAEAVLEKAIEEYPEKRKFSVFYAMVLHNLNKHGKAMESSLT